MAKKIIVVDDEEDILLLMRRILENRNYEVALSKNGQELFTRLKTERPDLIILDVMMPGISGFEVCRQLKSLPETKQIPVLLLTVLMDKNDVRRGMASGADAYLNKPFDPDLLIREIDGILQKGN